MIEIRDTSKPRYGSENEWEIDDEDTEDWAYSSPTLQRIYDENRCLKLARKAVLDSRVSKHTGARHLANHEEKMIATLRRIAQIDKFHEEAVKSIKERDKLSEDYNELEEEYNRLEEEYNRSEWMYTMMEAEFATSLLSIEKKSAERIFEIPSVVGGHAINALGDSGARQNFMNESFAHELGFCVDRQDIHEVKIGSGQTVKTAGSVSTTFKFKGEHIVHHLVFQLLPNCVQNVILSKTFMKATKTLTTCSHRIKERLDGVFSNPHFLYLGESCPMFEGYVNSTPQIALGDTGAKVPILDEKYAEHLGIDILKDKEHQTRLRFADGSTALTSGMAYDVEWKYGDSETPYFLDFHILPNAPASVILCDTFLFDTKAFQFHEECLIDDDDEDEYSHCFAIDKDVQYHTQSEVKNLSQKDRQHLETVRRGEVQDKIGRLPEHEREAAEAREQQRQQEWQRQTDLLLAGHDQIPQLSISQAASLPTARSTWNFKKRFKWLRFKKVRSASDAVVGAASTTGT